VHGESDPGGVLRIEVVFSARAGSTECVCLTLPAGATLREALEAGAMLPAAADTCVVGIWGKVKPLDTPLRDLDRVEIYRALQVDPKEARRLRYKQQKQARSGA
jgi:putative ubiquitin-RnfH superfamily antitoxin RatB of RatAB toxin-antitoxin module